MYEIDYKAMGKRFRAKRVEMGLTQEQLAELVGVGGSHIGEIERGRSICSLAVLVKIADVLKLNLDTLVKGVNSENANQVLAELLDEMPDSHKDLYVKLCENLAEGLK